MLPSANDLKALHSLSILKWCDFILVWGAATQNATTIIILRPIPTSVARKHGWRLSIHPWLFLHLPFFCWVSDHPASSPETFSWHGVPSTARTVVLQLSCDGIWLPRSMGEGPGISAYLRVSPQHCTWPRRLQTWDTDRAGGVTFHLTRVFATKKMH